MHTLNVITNVFDQNFDLKAYFLTYIIHFLSFLLKSKTDVAQ